MKKKLLTATLIGFGLFALVGCGDKPSENTLNNPPSETTVDDSQKETAEPSKEEKEKANVEIKEKATKADFVKINGQKPNFEPIYIKGEVSFLNPSEYSDNISRFTITSKENDGFGMYTGVSSEIEDNKKLKEGETITIYGYATGKTEAGLPEILVSTIDF